MLERPRLTEGALHVMPLPPGRSLEGDFRGGPFRTARGNVWGCFERGKNGKYELEARGIGRRWSRA